MRRLSSSSCARVLVEAAALVAEDGLERQRHVADRLELVIKPSPRRPHAAASADPQVQAVADLGHRWAQLGQHGPLARSVGREEGVVELGDRVARIERGRMGEARRLRHAIA
ncbi:hypothetical protein [Nannocystis pusilla]|uniref:hypothetical protein n=1 Tax=Nannocystis pusilla TaxID=889268 RepID=UPI003B832B7F